jgi:predicted ATP-grasp superfamily ATP-dependent carboligase
LYTGGLENHPQTIETISRTRPLWGNSPEVVSAVRDPVRVAEVLTQAGLPAPRVARSTQGVPADGSWLRKPLRSAGGARISPWRGEIRDAHAGWYYQERVAGEPCSAVYVADGAKAVLLGVTRQLSWSWLHASTFAYAGSIGPLALAFADANWQAIGHVLARAFNLQGLFGVDALIDATGVWPVEVNPRYVASAEVLEAAARRSMVGLHVAACRDGVLPKGAVTPTNVCYGKGIYYAPRDLVFDEAAFVAASGAGCADLPHPGAVIEQGQPVFTLFARDDSHGEVLAALRVQAQTWDARWG